MSGIHGRTSPGAAVNTAPNPDDVSFAHSRPLRLGSFALSFLVA